MLRLLILAVLACVMVPGLSTTQAEAAGGKLLWQATFDLAGGEDLATAVAAADGRVVVVGAAQNAAGDGDLVVLAHHARTGAVLWKDRVDLSGGADRAVSVVMNSLLVVVAGTGGDAAGNSQALVRAYLARTGTLLWTDRWPGSGISIAMEGPFLIVAGTTVDATGETQFLVRAYLGAIGAVLWTDRSTPPGFKPSSVPPKGLAVGGGKAFVAASVDPDAPFPPAFSCLVRAFDIARGRLLWQTVHEVSTFCTPAAIATAGRQVIVAGLGGNFNDEFVVHSYDAATGDFLWQDRVYDGSRTTNAAVAADADGRRAFIAGWRQIPTTTTRNIEAFAVRSYDTETGTLLWEDEHHGNAVNEFTLWHGLDTDASKRRVFAVGQDVAQGTWLVRAYEARRGDVLWENESLPAGPFAQYGWTQAVAVEGGRLFVAGSGFNAAGNPDMILRAYDAK